MRAKITKRVVDGAEPREATFLVRDTEVRGFVLVVTPAGAKSYAVDYRAGSGRGAPKRRLTIGKHGSPWTPETARIEAKRHESAKRTNENSPAIYRWVRAINWKLSPRSGRQSGLWYRTASSSERVLALN